ncbi:MAG: T9SS type A sorting domain-containing protein [Vicingaceae bacterium]
MKQKLKDLFWIGIMFFLSTQLVAQTNQCENNNGGFEIFSGSLNNQPPNTSIVSWINDSLDNWYVSHGAPLTLPPPPPPQNSNYTPTNYMSFDASIPNSTGIYTNYSFIGGKTYEITFNIWMKSSVGRPNTDFRVELSNWISKDYSGTIVQIPPSFTQNQLLLSESYSNVGTYGGAYFHMKKTFTASQNYNQLWFYLINNDFGSELMIDDCCVNTISNPCDVLKYAEIEVTGTNPYTFNVNGVPNGFVNSISYYWDFGDGNSSSAQSFDHTYSLNVVGVDSVVYPVCLSVYYFDPVTAQCCSEVVCTDVTIYMGDPIDPIDDGGGGVAGGLVRHNGNQTRPYFESGLNYETEPIENLAGQSKLLINPNPSKGMFQVQTLSEELINEVLVYSLEGMLVHQLTNVAQNDELTMDLQHIEPGTYIIISNQNNGKKIQAEKVFILP